MFIRNKKTYCLFLIIVLILTIISCENKRDELVREYNEESLQFDREGNQEEAIQLASKAIELKKDNAILYYNRAICYKKLQKYEQMANDLTKAIELYKKSDNFLIRMYEKMLENRYYAYYKLLKNDRALNDINSLIKIDSVNAEYYQKRGQVYIMLDSLLLAIRDYNKVILLDSTMIDAYFGRAMGYFDLKQYAKSLDDADIYLKSNNLSENYAGLYIRGAAFIELEKYQKAKQDLENYSKYEPEEASVYLLLAVIHYRLDNFILANDYFSKADSLKTPKDTSWEFYDGFIYYSTNIKSILKEWGKL